ncbi:hypothetical protein ACH5RR_039980 [Cinchona calisaya]|uniref:Premnaspirodiene oxygenase-like n=1 Tax=Cinchona calisaya TaxID=153742 RepID=A0ABD2Y379_9GENT
MELPLNSIALFVFLAFLLGLLREWKRSKAAQKLPPSPWKLPFIGNLHHLIGSKLPHHTMRKLAQKHGPLMHLQLGELSSIVVSSSRLAKEVMKTHDLAFANRATFQSTKIMMYNCTDIACAPYGDYWRQMRKICTLELLSAKTVRSFCPIRQSEASHLVSCIDQALAAAAAGGKEEEAIINIAEKMHSYASSMTCRAAFGNVVSRDDKDAFLKLINESITTSKGMEISDLFPSYKILHLFSVAKAEIIKTHYKCDKILNRILDQHIDKFLATTKMPIGESDHEDLIDVLLRVKESGDLQFHITNDNIKAVVMVGTLFFFRFNSFLGIGYVLILSYYCLQINNLPFYESNSQYPLMKCQLSNQSHKYYFVM